MGENSILNEDNYNNYFKIAYNGSYRILKNRELAEESAQESLLKAHLKIHQFNGKSKIESWIYRIATNTAKNKTRKIKPQEQIKPYTEPSYEMPCIASVEQSTKIQTFIQTLPPRQHMALTLRMEGRSFKEIAALMDSKYDTAKANCRHAKQKLQRFLDDHEN